MSESCGLPRRARALRRRRPADMEPTLSRRRRQPPPPRAVVPRPVASGTAQAGGSFVDDLVRLICEGWLPQDLVPSRGRSLCAGAAGPRPAALSRQRDRIGMRRSLARCARAAPAATTRASGVCYSSTAASQRKLTSSRAQATATTPAGFPRRSASVRQRACRRRWARQEIWQTRGSWPACLAARRSSKRGWCR
jgi:hypothetical protein